MGRWLAAGHGARCGRAVMTEVRCVFVARGGAGNGIGEAIVSKIETLVELCAVASLQSAQRRLSIAKAISLRLGADSVLADCPPECVEHCARFCMV
eukprot:SAG31_NODE_4039_length_3643_cov_51.767212_3_plen_96_part_00